ncbi:MAG: rhodanese-like domain-containing protein [Proteobacteria bacterium]|nr:rhodanese-like domain-containing protein [Pseudomonadota bacterium]
MLELKKGIKALVAEAENQVQSLTPTEVELRLQQAGVLLVDLRDIRELKREGKIPESLHVPRGMLEFWIDPESPYYKAEFDDVNEIILYCNKGWRSALAAQTLQNMGIDKVAHLQGGMEQWQIDIGRIDKN